MMIVHQPNWSISPSLIFIFFCHVNVFRKGYPHNILSHACVTTSLKLYLCIDMKPRDKLKRVLSSSDAFCDYYVELTELTLSTLKYIGHTRMAKVLGQQLAKFYM